MIHANDGPAAGQCLPARRAPLLLRLVQNRMGWYALDVQGATHHAYEQIDIYRRIGEPGREPDGSPCAEYEWIRGTPHSFCFRQRSYWETWATLNFYTPTPPPPCKKTLAPSAPSSLSRALPNQTRRG